MFKLKHTAELYTVGGRNLWKISKLYFAPYSKYEEARTPWGPLALVLLQNTQKYLAHFHAKN
jgi:hypothetical protein